MLPVPVVPGAALAAATARALAAAYGLQDPAHDPSDDEDGQDAPAAAADAAHDPASVLPRPGRAGGMLDDQGPPPPSPAAAVAAPPAAAVAAAPAAPPADRAAAEHRARAEPSQDQDDHARARAEPMSGDAVSSRSCGRTQTTPRTDEETKTEESDAAAAKLRCAEAPAPGTQPHNSRPDHGLEDPVQAVYAHNAAAFECALCPYAARDLTALAAHRRTAHRGARFVDHFHSGCTCGIGFQSRAAATKHALACGQSAHANEAAVRDAATQATTTPELCVQRNEEDPPPTGPLSAAAPAAAAAASSDTATADAATLQSAVPTAAAGLQYDPPVLEPLSPPPELRVAGKRRRLNGRDDVAPAVDLDALMQEAEDELMDELADDAEMRDATASPTPPAPTPPRPTRWGPRHKAVGAAAIARLVAGEATVPAPTRRQTQPPNALGHRATRWGPRLAARSAESTSAAEPPSMLPPGRTSTRWGPRVTVTPPPPGRWPRTRGAPSRTADQLPDSAAGARGQLSAGASGVSDQALADTTAVAMTVDGGPADLEPWTLRFDGACRRNPGPGGSGAALFDPSGTVVWTCSHFLPASNETNNTAEYTGLLVGVLSALHHGVQRLLIEGDSNLVLAQVKGSFACTNARLRRLRNRVRHALRGLGWSKLRHIDRKANAHADRLANRALDLRKTLTECGPHDGAPATCYAPTAATTDAAPAATRPAPAQGESIEGDTATDDIDAEIAARDSGEVFPTLPIGPDSAPARQPRLRLRQLTEEEFDAASASLETFADAMACKLTDADSWATGEGYISSIPNSIRELLQPYTTQATPPHQQQQPRDDRQHDQQQPRLLQDQPRHRRRHRQRRRPPRVTRDQREHRLDEALDDMAAVQRERPDDRTAIRKARRRVGRIRSATALQRLRHDFARDEAKCVATILKRASAETAAEEHPDTCPIGREELHRHFTGTNAPRSAFDFDAVRGQEFRAALANFLPAAGTTAETDAFDAELMVDEVEDQLNRTTATSSPGHDGVGYDIYRRFAAQLVPLLHAVFQFCWTHRRVPALWKVGIVRLIHKKGDPTKPTNWRPICLQPTIYKLYSGLLARRLSRWLEGNNLLPMAQKGFRSFNGCHEHNFVATTLLDQTRRLHRKLYQVWYDLQNAFGSLPQELMWRVLAELGVEPSFIARCQDIYAESAFVVANAADGPTDPVRQEVGVYQGCPLSPLLFIAALVPLLRRLEQLDGAGVPLAEGVHPCATAYADDLKVFSDSAAGIKRCHGVVARFLAWTGLRANPAKCASLAVTTNARGNPTRDDSVRLAVDGDAIATLSLQESYRYLGVGDGFDHVRHRLQLEPKLQQIKREAVALMQSGLATWQVVKALKTYVYPKVEYALRHLRPLQSQLQGFDRAVVRGLRHLLRLPQSTTTEFFFTPTSSGGLGLQSLVELHQALQVAHAWQMLHSKDPAVAAVAKTQVGQVARKRYRLNEEHWRGRDEELVRLFLNSELAASPFAEVLRRNGDIGSLWVDVQRTLLTHHLSLAARDDRDGQDLLGLRVPHHTKWLDHKTVLRHVKLHMKIRHQTRWKGLVDQGKTVRVHGGLGAKFVTTGAGLSDAEHRFGIQARLNQVDTNAVLKRKRLRANAACRDPTCSSAETLPHVLNHCASNMDAIRQRHDDALEQIGAKIRGALARAKSTTELRLNQTVPEYTGAALRPDIVLRNVAAQTVVIADLAVTFEDQAASARHSSLQLSHDHKTLKYQPIVAELRHKGWRVQIGALVYGSLGSVQPSNFKTYTEQLKLLKREARQLDIQLSSHCIRASHRIWGWHCRQHRERQRCGTASRASRGSGGAPRRTSQAPARR
jgi:ribonuclease HI